MKQIPDPKDVEVFWRFAPAYQKARKALSEKLQPWASQLLDSTYERAFCILEENSQLAYAVDCEFFCTPIYHKGERVDLMSLIILERENLASMPRRKK